MGPVKPYQPALLRLLHGAVALLVPFAWFTGLAVYSTDDGRWGRIPGLSGDWVDVHGTFGVLLWPVALLFALYALSLGSRYLKAPANATALLALALAVVSGKWMDEDWLREGHFDQFVYSLHLLAWLLLALAVLWHVVAVLRRGGPQLALSMFASTMRPSDRPEHWIAQLKSWWLRRR